MGRFTGFLGVGNYNIWSGGIGVTWVKGRILAVDLGARRVGLAISDPSGTLARPFETIAVTSAADAVERVARRIQTPRRRGRWPRGDCRGNAVAA